MHAAACGSTERQVTYKRKAADDVGSRPSNVMRSSLSSVNSENFYKNDLKKLPAKKFAIPIGIEDLVELHIIVHQLDTVTSD